MQDKMQDEIKEAVVIEDGEEAVIMSDQNLDEEEVKRIEEALELIEAERQAQLAQFSASITLDREEAIRARAESGIEEIWDEDEDAYLGVDDANRGEEINQRSHKGSYENNNRRNTESQVKSTVFLNITRPYTDAAAARVGDMLLPSDDRNWAYRTTPVSEIAKMAMNGDMGKKVQQIITQSKNKLKKQLEDAEKQVDDWLIECNYSSEVRRVIDDCAKAGTGVLKGPFPEKRRTANGEEIKPASKYVNYRNLFPDPSCGEDIQNGKYVFERDTISVRQLRDLSGLPGYLPEQVQKVLEEGPGKRLVDDDSDEPLQDSELFEIWYFYGLISTDDMQACQCETESAGEMIPAMATLINDTVIHVNEYPTDDTDFPYDVINWQRRQHHWAGVGISRQIRTPQRMLNAATRNMMDNAGISAGPQIIYRKDVIKPENGSYELTPGKRWFAEDDMDIQSVSNAIMAINIPSMQGQLNEIISFAMKMAEDVTGMPQIMQGNQGNAPDTVGGMTILNNNSNTVLRRIARNFDNYITIPHVKRYYQWQVMHEGAEGDYQIEARGSSALIERDLQSQAILQMGQMVLNPAFGVKPDLWMQEYLKSLKFDPKRFQGEDEKDGQKEMMMKQLQGMGQELKSRKGEKQAELQYKYAELKQEREIALMKLAMDKDMKLADLKSKLGLESMKVQKGDIKTQQDFKLNAIDKRIKSHDAQTRRMKEQNSENELKFKAATGLQGI